MKFTCILLSQLIIFLLFSSATFTESGKVLIEVTALRNSTGIVQIMVYNKEKDFLEDAGVIKTLTGAIKNNKCVIDSGTLPYGQYSFGLLHDENSNKEMDYNWMKMPKEGFGFSNNPKIGMSAPGFNETKVTLNAPEKKIVIQVKYM
jgi:uncharacterized protein (DUF2141 family)